MGRRDIGRERGITARREAGDKQARRKESGQERTLAARREAREERVRCDSWSSEESKKRH